MAHIRQEGAFGAAGAFRDFASALQLSFSLLLLADIVDDREDPGLPVDDRPAQRCLDYFLPGLFD